MAWSPRAALYRLQEPLERTGLAALLDLADPKPSDVVLDVATGTSAVLAALAARPRRAARAVGVDRDAALLAGAPPLPEGYRLQRGDALALPFADASFDVVLAGYLLHVLDPPERARAVAEMARVVVPEGRVATLTVWHPRAGARRVSSLLPRRSWLRAVDPTADLEGAGLRLERRAFTARGWPSLVLVARRPTLSRGA